eukprot:3351861-Rhodomonas_salina.2
MMTQAGINPPSCFFDTPYSMVVLTPYGMVVLAPYGMVVLTPYCMVVLTPYGMVVLTPYGMVVLTPYDVLEMMTQAEEQEVGEKELTFVYSKHNFVKVSRTSTTPMSLTSRRRTK